MIKTWGARIYRIGERRRLVLLLAAILLLGVVLFFINTARAATVVLLPNADIGTPTWSQCTSLTCSISRYFYVDEDASATTITSDYVNTGAAGTSDAAASIEFGLTTTSNVNAVSNVTVYILARSGTNANGGALDAVDMNLRIGGTLQTAVRVTPAFASGSWNRYSASFSGNWSQTELDGAQILFTRVTLGSGNPTNQRDDVQIGAASATVTYTQSSTFGQSAYRWFSNTDASGTQTFAKAYGASGSDYPYDMNSTSDGGFITAGATSSYGAGSNDVLLTKYSSGGASEWTRYWGGTGSDVGYASTVASDGSYIVTGMTGSYGTGNDMFIMKYDSSGTRQWSRTWGGAGIDAAFGVATMTDGGTIAIGRTDSFGAGLEDVPLVKFDSVGAVVWEKTWGSSSGDIGRAVVATADGGFVVVGDTSQDGVSVNAFMTKFDSSGTVSWSRTWGGTGADAALGVAVAANGDYILSGQTTSFGLGADDAFIARYDSTGTLLWSRTWGGTGAEYGRAVAERANGNIIMTGDTASYGTAGDTYVAEFSGSGTLTGSRTFGGSGAEIGRKIRLLNGGGYDILSQTASYGAGLTDALITRYDVNGAIGGCSSPMCQTPAVTAGTPAAASASPSIASAAVTGSTSTSPVGSSGQTTFTDTNVVNQSGPAVDVGTAMAAQDVPATATNTGIYRLRLSLHILTGQADPGQVSFKLQYAAKGTGTCAAPSGGTPASYTDVTNTSSIGYANNTIAVDGQSIATNANDPSHSGHTIIRQSYEEGSASAVTASIATGQDGLWDFALKDNGAFPATSYCFRLVRSDGTPLTSYSTYPELVTMQAQYEQSGYRVYENAPINPGASTFAVSTGSNLYSDIDSTVYQTSDGGYITGGYSDGGTGAISGRVVKHDSTGLVSWNKRITYGEQVYVTGVVELSGGDIAVIGHSTYDTNDQGSPRSFIAKFSSTGTLLWLRDGTRDAFQYDVVAAADGSITTVGFTTVAEGAGGNDAVLMNFSASDGSVNWSRLLGGTSSDIGYDLAVLTDGNYVIGGKTQSYTAGGDDAFIAGYSSTGTFQWMKTVGGVNTDETMDISAAPDGGFAVLSSLAAQPNISKHSANGSLTWSSQITSGIGEFNGIAVTQSGDVVVSGFYSLIGDVQLAAFNSSGSLIYSGGFAESGVDYSYDVADTSDGGFVIIGDTDSAQLSRDSLLLKYDSFGAMAGCDSRCGSFAFTAGAGSTFTSRTPVANNGTITNGSNVSYTSGNGTESYTEFVSYDLQGAAPIEPGAPLAAANAAATLSSANSVFRVRATVHMTDKNIPIGVAFKLQYAARSSTCSATTGYSDVTTTSPIAFSDNLGGGTGDALGTGLNDPSHNGHTLTAQSYVESNNFTNSTALSLGTDGLWDFSLRDNSAPAGTTYCLRIVRADGSAFESYSQQMEVTTFGSGGGATTPTLNQQLRGGQSVIDGIKRGFLW